MEIDEASIFFKGALIWCRRAAGAVAVGAAICVAVAVAVDVADAVAVVFGRGVAVAVAVIVTVAVALADGYSCLRRCWQRNRNARTQRRLIAAP